MSDRSSAADAAFAVNPQGNLGAGAPVAQSASDSGPTAPPLPDSAPPPLPVGLPLHVTAGPPIPVALRSEPGPTAIEVGDEEESWRDGFVHLPSWLASMVSHLALVLALALLTTFSAVRDTAPSLVVSTESQSLEEGQLEELSATLMESSDALKEDRALEPAPLAELPATAMATGPIRPIFPSGDPTLIGGAGDTDALLASVGGNGLELRLNGQLRDALLRSGGGTPESEEAVRLALMWLAEHQNYDGSWIFQHHKHPKCSGSCANPGSTPGKIAATGLALLPFLGTGQTQFEGIYKRNIESGLKFLVRSIKHQGKTGSLWDQYGTMYGHGLASIALCEAYGMTRDPTLREPAQAVVNFIVEAQHPIGGGWRYHPQSPGDTSVVGWQLMALKSAQMAYLRVPQDTLRKAGYFLDSVQGERGAVYGYQRPNMRRPATTAIGLLGRMFLGWNRQTRALERGVQILGTLGPSIDKAGMRNNMYYNFYATQVMHHWGGYPWQRWNAVMRDYLIKTQSKRGHENGSWFFDGSDLGRGAGGRLYFTAMSAMTLEVYYRHMPLYRDKIASE